MENTTVQYPALEFVQPDDEYDVVIPAGHAAIVVKGGRRSARIDLDPGTHRLSGVAFDDIDVPFAVCVLPNHLADMAAHTRIEATSDLV